MCPGRNRQNCETRGSSAAIWSAVTFAACFLLQLHQCDRLIEMHRSVRVTLQLLAPGGALVINVLEVHQCIWWCCISLGMYQICM
uniref:Uncharacterized protein n=1 Tax=Setaria viridis TaxID=4556 RepID=A0A4U6TSK8_SETVI|nr:hypothetical protein SEVIR_7G191350v2 [Setaria viridis]